MPVRMSPENYLGNKGLQIDSNFLNLAIVVLGIVACVAIAGMVIKDRR